MGQNIGTCVTAMISSVGTNKNAQRAAVVHLMFNVIGVIMLLSIFCIVRAAFAPAILDEHATMYGIAIVHSVFTRAPSSWTSVCLRRRRSHSPAAVPLPRKWRRSRCALLKTP